LTLPICFADAVKKRRRPKRLLMRSNRQNCNTDLSGRRPLPASTQFFFFVSASAQRGG
jgi:hypothetical protein